jgi:hypothetical protein
MDPQSFPSQQQQINQPSSVASSKSYLPFIIGGLLILFLVGVGGFYLGKNINTFNKQATTPKPKGFEKQSLTPSLTIIPTAPITRMLTTEFQRLLQTKCESKSGKKFIKYLDLPFKADPSKTNAEDKEFAECVYNEKTNSSYLFIQTTNVPQGIGIEIYDKQSVMPEGMGAVAFYYEEVNKYKDDVSYNISLNTGDSVPPIEEESVAMSAIKKLTLLNGEMLYIRTNLILLPAGDKRLINLLMKYKSNQELYGSQKNHIDISKLDEINKDINQTFFQDLSNLQELERTNFNQLINILNSFIKKD